MRALVGTVRSGFGYASRNLRPVMSLIEARMSVSPLVPGTLNLSITTPYILQTDGKIEKDEYNQFEFIKLQRCRIASLRAIILRPNSHESSFVYGPSPHDKKFVYGPMQLEILSTVNLREFLQVTDGDLVTVQVEGDECWWIAR
jgi:CTP-dependent riboflavin kinase